MNKMEKIALLTDNTKTDVELSKILGLSAKYLPILRQRLGLSKIRGRRPGRLIKERIIVECSVCLTEFRKIVSSKQKYCSRKCMYSSLEYRDMLKSRDKSYMMTEKYRRTKMKEGTAEYKRYCNRVHKLSQKIYEENISILNPHGHVRTLCGVDGGYQLDHIVPLRYGFDNGITPEEISSLNNLRLLPWKQNLTKGKGSI
jgi:hypothetical protein